MTQWKADQLGYDLLVCPGCVLQEQICGWCWDTPYYQWRIALARDDFGGEDSWGSSSSLASIGGRAGYWLLRTFLLGPSWASDLWWEDIVGDKSPCQLLLLHMGGLNPRKLHSFLLEDHRDQLCLALVRTSWPRMKSVRLEGLWGAAHLLIFSKVHLEAWSHFLH